MNNSTFCSGPRNLDRLPSELEAEIGAFIEYYSHRRYYEWLLNVTSYGVYIGRHLEILQRRREIKSRTSQETNSYDRTARKQSNGPKVSGIFEGLIVLLSLTTYRTGKKVPFLTEAITASSHSQISADLLGAH